ncbi:LytTR family transcriptional regulator DNA-binding domain-containing protein [uncultured Flavobacterium sp.]|uniref:LytTR family transcriptional regulator DNA-binding domain-containing protein n=1 Tax=uncultured Flavobacterium sp. TaxID=165435 RepID=UPI0030C84557
MTRFFLYFFFVTLTLNAQNQANSEFKLLQSLSRKNQNNPDSLFFYGNKILDLGNKENDVTFITEGYFILSQSQLFQAKRESSIVYLDSALVYKDEINISNYFRLLRAKAIAYTQIRKFDEAELIYKEIIEQSKKINKKEEIAHTYNGLGMIKKQKNEHKKAIEYFEKALVLWDSLGIDYAKPGLYSNIGVSQKLLGDIESSNLSFHKGISFSKRNPRDKRTVYRLYGNLATNFSFIKNTDSTNFYLDKVIHHYKSTNQNFELSLAYLNRGQNKIFVKEIDSALWYLKKSLIEFKNKNQIPSKIENYRLLATAYLKKEEYDLALTYLDSAHKLSVDKHIKYDLENQYALYAEINEKKENYKKANEYLRANDSLKKAKYINKSENGFSQVLVLEDNKEKRKRIQRLDKENTFYKSNLFISFLIVLILAIVSFLLFKRYKNQKSEVIQLQNQLDSFNDEFSKKKEEAISTNAILKLKSNAVLNTTEILYIKSDGHYAEISIEGREKPEIERTSLSSLLELLPKQDFVRIHKSYVVNIHKIKIINSTEVMLENGEWIKLSRTYKQLLKDLLNKTN